MARHNRYRLETYKINVWICQLFFLQFLNIKSYIYCNLKGKYFQKNSMTNHIKTYLL